MYTPAVIEPAMGEKFSGTEPNRVRSGWGDFDLMLETLEAGLSGQDWILGDSFSAADVMLGSSVSFMRQFGMLSASAALGAYADRCEARPGFRKSLEIEPATD